MNTSRLVLNKHEVAAILPGLQAMMSAIACARHGQFPRLDPTLQFVGSAMADRQEPQPSRRERSNHRRILPRR